MNTFTKALVVIPEINKPKMTAAESINGTSAGLILSALLLTHRAQISASLGQLQKQAIQQLESVKWNARQIARNPIVRSFIVKLVIAETINYDLSNFKNLPPEEVKQTIDIIVKDLDEASPSRDCKILTPRAINQSNIKSHRLACIAQLIGTWQARPIFEPLHIIKNHPASALGVEQFSEIIFDLHVSFGIPLDPRLEELVAQCNNKTDALRQFLKESFEQSLNIGLEPLIFNDTVDFKSPRNLTPIEDLMPFITRPLPDSSFIEQDSLPNELLSSPLLNYGNIRNTALVNENMKSGFSKPSISSTSNVSKTAKSKPKAKDKANPSTKTKSKKPRN